MDLLNFGFTFGFGIERFILLMIPSPISVALGSIASKFVVSTSDPDEFGIDGGFILFRFSHGICLK